MKAAAYLKPHGQGNNAYPHQDIDRIEYGLGERGLFGGSHWGHGRRRGGIFITSSQKRLDVGHRAMPRKNLIQLAKVDGWSFEMTVVAFRRFVSCQD